ncbi:MAG: DUF72 domain-containing protein, partial [Acidimicrobiia bacterium]
KRDAERLDDFLAATPRNMRWAVEVRDVSWLHDDVFSVLERHRAALCIHDLLPDHPWVRTTSWAFVRFHGPDALAHPYQGRYGGRRLWRAARQMNDWLESGVDVYAYFNNDDDGHAFADAQWMRSRIDGARQPEA